MSVASEGSARQVFSSLDGLRGVAAILVVLFHAGNLVGGLRPASAYLAVDLFFILSGCVMEAAYGRKLTSGMSVTTLTRIRVIRLWPLYILGLALGAGFDLLALLRGHGWLSSTSIIRAAVPGFFMLPAPPAELRLSPLNPPAWSLTFELAINIAYGVFRPRLSVTALGYLVAVAGALLLYEVIAHDGLDFGFMWADVHLGLLRVTFFFFLGVLLLRAPRPAARAGGFALMLPVAVALILGLARPTASVAIGAAFLTFPLLIWLGLWLQPGRSFVRLFHFLGVTSYALYAVHMPIWTFLDPLVTHRIAGDLPRRMIALGLLAALVALSAFLNRFYDAPARRWIISCFERRSARRSIRRGLSNEAAASAP